MDDKIALTLGIVGITVGVTGIIIAYFAYLKSKEEQQQTPPSSRNISLRELGEVKI